MKFVMNRDLVLSSTLGHRIVFKKGVAKHVPEAMVEAVMARGGLPDDGEMPEHKEEEETTILRGTARQVAIGEAIAKLAKTNNRNDFTGSGLPHTKAIEGVVKFTVTSEERNEAWQKHTDALDSKKTGEVVTGLPKDKMDG